LPPPLLAALWENKTPPSPSSPAAYLGFSRPLRSARLPTHARFLPSFQKLLDTSSPRTSSRRSSSHGVHEGPAYHDPAHRTLPYPLLLLICSFFFTPWCFLTSFGASLRCCCDGRRNTWCATAEPHLPVPPERKCLIGGKLTIRALLSRVASRWLELICF
jgi:hypothetical protein